MGKNVIKEEIVELLEVIVEQSEVINTYEKQIPQIEIDIILSNIRELYDKFRALEKDNKTRHDQQVPVIEKPIIQEVVTESVIIEKIVEEKAPAPEQTPLPVPEGAPVVESKPAEKEEISIAQTEPPVVVAAEIKKEIIPEPVIDETAETALPQEEKKPKSKKFSLDLFSSPGTIADKFKDEKKSLNEKISTGHTDKSIASKLQKNPIKDLKAAIGINEKFRFINELFDGSLQRYNDCITQLNGFAGSEAALKYLSFLKDEFAWKEDSDVYHELLDLVTRRYL